jgi:hypothetical protein
MQENSRNRRNDRHRHPATDEYQPRSARGYARCALSADGHKRTLLFTLESGEHVCSTLLDRALEIMSYRSDYLVLERGRHAQHYYWAAFSICKEESQTAESNGTI